MIKVARDQLCYSYSADNPPAVVVQPGEEVLVETNDRLASYEGPGPDQVLKSMSGPIYVEGVVAGDTIRIDFLDMTLPFDHGWITTAGYTRLKIRAPEHRKKRVSITARGVEFSEAITLPLRPMISRVGVAPAVGAEASIAKGAFSGAMGNRLVTKGSAVYLPAFHDGALLTLGDGHAAQGDGEATASAVECAVDVTLRITIEKRFKVERPIVTTESLVMTTGEGETMEAASHGALGAMQDLLVENLHVDHTDAAMLIATAGDVRPGIASYPPYTMAVAMPRTILPL